MALPVCAALIDDPRDAELTELYVQLQYDEVERASATARISQIVQDLLLNVDSDQALAILTKHLPTVIRLRTGCPHCAVREWANELVSEIGATGCVDIPSYTEARASKYIPEDKVPAIDDVESAAHVEFVEAFSVDGRVSNMTRMMALHPEYLTCYRTTHREILYGAGPLSETWRLIIAIAAVAKHQNKYWFDILAKQFLDRKGERDWLKGSEFLPQKLQALLVLNSVLAFQPWLLKVNDIGDLVKSGTEGWSIVELVQAINIMVHFHMTVSFTAGCGVVAEPDMSNLAKASVQIPGSPPPPDDGAGAAVEPVQTETHSFVLSPPGKKSSKFYVQEMMSLNGEEDTEAANFANFEAAEPIEAGSSWHHTQAEDIPSFDYVEVSAEDTTHGRGADWKVPIGVGPHADYDIKEKELYTVFRLRAFSWEDQGYATLHRYFPDLAELFDMKFNTTRDLTYEYMGDESGVDTFKFRYAVWNYVMRIKGILRDDYQYREVNDLMEREMKAYVKTAACCPHMSTDATWANFAPEDLDDGEKVHINILAMEARGQSELLYALRAVSEFVRQR